MKKLTRAVGTRVSVVIPNWNGLEYLKICLPSLKKQTYLDREVIVIDNGSSDGSVQYIKDKFPEIKLVVLARNVGFAPAVNVGVNKSTGQYIVLINNDTKVDRNCLKYLVQAAQDHPEVGMVAAKMLNFYQPDRIDSTGDYIDVVGHANNIGLGQRDGPEFNLAGNVFLVTGGGGLFKREVFDRIGLFDEDYFAYFEDVDLCLRAQMVGFKGWYQPRAVIYHIHKATSNRHKSLTEYWQFRNMTMTVLKDFPGAIFRKNFNWLRILLVNINTIRFLAQKGYFMAAVRAEWYILWNLPKIWRKRQIIQAMKTVSDSYLVSNIRDKKISLFGLFKEGI